MAGTTGIAWTNATVNFVIGCTKVGPGCEHCYAATFALQKWNIVFEPGGRRHVTQSGFRDPLRWQRAHDANKETMKNGDPVPVWVFACSLSDFFDNEWPENIRTQAWQVIRACPSLRWQIVTKRIGNVPKMLPADWNDGRNYRNVGIVATMVNQEEYDRDALKLAKLYDFGVHWTGISVEPQLGPITINTATDWIICGGESKQGGKDARPFHLEWARSLRDQCGKTGISFFMKQMGDNPVPPRGNMRGFGSGGDKPELWPADLRIQQMPNIYDAPKLKSYTPDLFNGGS